MRLVQLSDLVQQLARLCRVRYPRRCASQSCLEIVRPSTQELVSYVQRLSSFNRPKDALTGQDTPALVSNIHKYIVAAYTKSIHRLQATVEYEPLKAQNGSR